jgi:hypothetical protein
MSEFDQLLDESLIYLQVTGSVEAALAAYPEQAEALRPLLLAAAAVQNTPRPLARPAAVRAGRERIQAAFAARRQAGAFANQPAVFSLLSAVPAWWRGRSILKELFAMNIILRPALTVLTIAFLGGMFLLAASGNSLPGEPLYPLKLLWETTRLALTADPQARQLIEEELRQERIEELRALIESGREQVITFEGRLEAVRADAVVVDGFTVLVNRQTVWQDRPVAGEMVVVEVHIASNGALTARHIYRSSGGQAVTPTPTPTAKATSCNNITCETVTPSPTEPTAQATPSHTPIGCNFGACPTETGEPTEPPTLTPSPTGPTPNVTPSPTACNFGFCGTVTATPTAAGQSTAIATPILTPTPTNCPDPSCGDPTNEPTPPPNDTATPLPFTATPSATPACPPIGCNEPSPTPTPAVTASSTPIPLPTETPAGATPTPTPCNGGACQPPTATPGGTETATPTAAPTDTPDPLPSPTECNWGMCGGPADPSATPGP